MNRQLYKYHPNIGHTFIPGLKTRVIHESGGYLVKVNQEGYRSNREFEPVKKPDVFRLLLFGDSFTAGDGVSNLKRYSDVLEMLLPGLEVYNFGLSGTGTDQQYLIFQEMAGHFEYDLVLIGVTVENIRRVAARYKVFQSVDGDRLVLPKPYFIRTAPGNLQRKHFPVPKVSWSENQLSRSEQCYVDSGGRFNWLYRFLTWFDPIVLDIVQRVSRYQPLPAYDSADNPDWLLMKTILTSWLSEVSQPAVVCPIPVHQYIEETASSDAYRARFGELCESTGARLHDPLPDYWQTPRASRRQFRFQKDPHPTPASHQLLAESLVPTIRYYMEKGTDL